MMSHVHLVKPIAPWQDPKATPFLRDYAVWDIDYIKARLVWKFGFTSLCSFWFGFFWTSGYKSKPGAPNLGRLTLAGKTLVSAF